MDEVASMESTRDAVGTRLDRLRGRHEVALADASGVAGISKSTLSHSGSAS